jgi:predicted deacylase
MTEHGNWTTRRVDTADGAIGVTVHTLTAAAEGPSVVVLGGVHGNEIGGIVAAGQLTATVRELRAGTVQVVPVAHEAAHAAFSRTGPADGGNLARSFPGRADGAPTDRLAALIGERLIRDADVLLDLHTSSPDADMPFFAGGLDDGSPAATRGTELAVAFGAGVVWTHPSLGEGRTLTLAHELGIPALYVESPRGGVLDRRFLDGYVVGVRRVLSALDMLADDVPPARPPELWLHGEGDTDAFAPTPVDGWFVGEVELLDAVVDGQLLGRVVDRYGACRHEVVAPSAGVVMTLRTAANVVAGTPLVGIAPPRPPTLGLASDKLVQHRGARR